MNSTIELLKARMHLLQQRDAVTNANIIRKLQRRIRLLEAKANE